MDGVLKGLVAVACIAVIALAGEHFWGRYQRHQTEVDQALAERYIRCSSVAEDVERAERGAPTRSSETESVLRLALAGCKADGILP